MRQAAMVLFFMFICASGIAQSMGNYTFSQSVGTYAEITGGTVLGNETSDEQKFVDPAAPLGGTTNTGVGLPMGFNFYYAGQEFDRLAVCTNGWISLGQSWETTAVNIGSSSNTAPLGSTYGINPPWQVSRVAVLAMDLQAQAGSTIRLETIGTAPYRVCVVQWKGYRKKNAAGENLNFQIRLEETTNKVVLSYGLMTVNATSGSPQVGMRAEPATAATNYANRTTTTDWSATTAGTAANSTCTLSNTVYPANGTTFTWSPPAALSSSYTIGSSGDFTTFAAAFNFLNDNYPLYGIPEGGTIFNVAAGQVFNQAEILPALTATGDSLRPITFRKSGTGDDPILKVMGTTSTTDAAIKLNGGDWFTFEHLDLRNADGSTSLEIGFHLSAQSYDPCNKNTFSYCAITLDNSNANTKAVYSTGTTGAGNTGNNYAHLDINNCNTGIHLLGNSSVAYYNLQEVVEYCNLSYISANGIYFDYATSLRITQNTIAMKAANNVAFYGISSLRGTAEVDNNTIIGNTTTVAYVIGLYGNAGTLVNWHHNTIRDISGYQYVYGININNGNHVIHANEIVNIFASSHHVYGIYLNSGADEVNISGNEIHNIKYTGAAGSAYLASGISLYGTDVTVANNFIYDISSTGDGAPMIRGITAVTGGTFKIYYNTIYLKGGNSNTNFGSAGIYVVPGPTTLDLRNNIIVDLSTPGTGTTGRAVAIWKSYTGFANFAPTCDRNIYYAGTPGPKNLICFDGTAYETLSDYKAAIMTCDLGSLTENVTFTSTVEPYDLHIPTGTSTLAESNALPIASWDFDFDGDNRHDEFPDIGADEGSFTVPAIPPDPPVLINPADGAIVVQPSATLNWAASSTGGAPTGYRLYFGTNLNSLAMIDLGNVTIYDPEPDMQFLTTYYWKIVPYNAAGPADSVSYSHWSFETHAAPLTGEYVIGSTGYYSSFSLAITHLNAAGVGSGGVTYQAIAGEVFAENPIPITATGTADDPIVFTSTDTLAVNPKLTPTGGTDTFALKIEGGDYITIHHIDVANLSSANNLANGFWIEGVTGNGADHVTIRNCSITLDRAVTSTAIYLSGVSSSTGTKVLENSIDNTTRAVYLYPTATAYNSLVQGNEITNAIQGIYLRTDNGSLVHNNQVSFPSNATTALNGIYLYNSTGTQVSDNTVIGGSTTSTCSALYNRNGTNAWFGNLVSNLHSNGAMEGFDIYGGTLDIHDNEFTALSSNQTIFGIDLNLEGGGSAQLYRNKVHNIQSNATAGYQAYGIVSGSTTNLVHNNLIYDIRNPGGSTVPQAYGLQVNGGSCSLYYNSVYLDASGTNDNFSSAALYVTGGSSILMNNNIFMNTGTPGSSGKSVAFWKTTDGFTNFNSATDRNIYHAGTPGTSNLICWTPSASYQTLDDYKAATVTFDQNSFTEEVPFASAVSPYDLHITPSAATQAESNGIAIAGISMDYDKDLRAGETGYAGTGTAPDIGADEGEFTVPLLVPDPANLVAPTDGDYAVSIQPTLTWYASSSGGAPTGYRLSLWAEDPEEYIEASTDLGIELSYNCTTTLDYLRTYYWRIVPYNDNGSPDSLDCPVWSFSTHKEPLTGSWVIGTGHFYPDFTHAIRYLNASGVGSGGITFTAVAGEVFAENPPAITATGTALNPVVFTSTDTLATNPKITPAGGTGTYAFKLEGCDFFTFDHIDIANATGFTNLNYGIWLEAPTSNGCTDNTIQACGITLDRSSECYAIREDSASNRVNHRNSYLRNTISNVRYGIYLYNTDYSSALRIQSNQITDFSSIAIYSRESTGIEISHNQLTMVANNTMACSGISLYADNGLGSIHDNTITGSNTTQTFTGIYHTSANFDIHHNTISGVTSSNAVYGIRNNSDYSANFRNVYQNVISDLTSTGNYYVWGIYQNRGTIYKNTITGLVSGGNVRGISAAFGTVYQNDIHNLQTNSTNDYACGLLTSNTATAHNNMICDLRAPNSNSAASVRGIYTYNGAASLYYNSVLITGSGTASFSSAALFDYSCTTLTLQNNIFSNLSTPGTSGMAVAFWKSAENFTDITTASNNNIWYAGTPGAQNLICYYGTISCETLDDYKTANLGKDQNSYTENPPFLSEAAPYNLHLDPLVQTYAEGNALVVASVAVDYDGDERDSESPDIGADEGDFTEVQLPPSVVSYLSPANGAIDLALNIPIAWAPGSGGGDPDYYKVYFGETNPPPLVDDNVLTTHYYPFLLPERTYYWKVDAVNTLGTAAGVEVWSFDTRADNTIMEFPFTESFEEGNTNGSTTINRWTQALGSGSYYWTANTSTSYNRTPRTGTFNLTLRENGNAWLFRPIYLEQGQSYGLELWGRQYTSSGSQAILEIKYGTAGTIAAMAYPIVAYKEVVNGAYQRAAGTFTAPYTGIWYLGIHGICTGSTNYLSIDDISVDYYEPYPVFSVNPASWNFGMVNSGEASAAKTFVVSNTGDADLIILQSDVYLDGADIGDFILTPLAEDLTIEPGNTANLYVVFAPQSIGAKTATLTVVDNVGGRAVNQIPLSGRGIGPLVPPCVEDFEEGWIDWITINGTQSNKWELGTATNYRNSYSAYISSNNGATHSYNPGASSYVHFYHDVTFPADMTGMKLIFQWKGVGEAGFDFMTVHITDTSFIPTVGTSFTEGQIGDVYHSSADWQLVSLPLSAAYAIQTKRLIFSWRNDGGGGTQPPAAIDNIRIYADWPYLDENAYPADVQSSASGGSISLTWDKVDGANDYIIEDSDMFDGVFTPIGRGYNVFTVPGSYPKRFFRVRATD